MPEINEMVGPSNSLRYIKTAYRRQQLDVHQLLSRSPLGGAKPEESYDQEYVLNIIVEQAILNSKYEQRFANQSEHSKTITERKKNIPKPKFSTKSTNHIHIEHSRTKNR